MDDTIHLPAAWQGWQIEEPIGAGSYGEVYRAVYHGTDPSVTAPASAVKIIRLPAGPAEAAALAHEMPSHEDRLRYYRDIVEGLRSEIRAMETLRGNENIVALQDYRIESHEEIPEWTIFIRMELLTPLPDYLITHAPEEAWILRLGTEMCKALAACEENEILHRDIKPENILVTEDGTFRLGDFGVARRMDLTTASLSLKGTFTYMAPEVYHGEKYDAKADQYSLGMVLYRLLNRGRDPFMDPDARMVYFRDREEALRRRMKGEPLPSPADASPNLARVLAKACAFSPDDRYADIAGFRHDLAVCAGVISGEGLIADRDTDAGNAPIPGGKIPAGAGAPAEQADAVESQWTEGQNRPVQEGLPAQRTEGQNGPAREELPVDQGRNGRAHQVAGQNGPSQEELPADQGRSGRAHQVAGQNGPAREGLPAQRTADLKKGRKRLYVRIGAALAAAVLILAGLFWSGLISFTNVVASGSCGNALTWQLTKDGILTISGTGMMDSYELLHPSPWRFLDSDKIKITEVHVEEGVTGIGSYAFRMCTFIRTIQLPESLEYIGEGAFSQCWNLPSVTVGRNVSYVGTSSFSSSMNLRTITVEDGNPLFDSRDHCNAVIETASDTLVAGCGRSVIPDSVTAIGEGAFAGCVVLTEIDIPDSVVSIADTAFADCSEDLVIRGSAGSAAETYAEAHGITFQAID